MTRERTGSEIRKQAAVRKQTHHMSWEQALKLKKGDGVLFRYKKIMRRGFIHYDPKLVPPEGPTDVRWFMVLIKYGRRHFIPAFWVNDGWRPSTAVLVTEKWT